MMDNKEFREIWDMLDKRLSQRPAGHRLTDLHHGGKIGVARRLQQDLDAWCLELAARAKAEFDSAKANYDALRDEVGAGFDAIEPNHVNGLDFGEMGRRHD